MNIRLEMENKKAYNIHWEETLEDFQDHITFAEGNCFLLTNSGTYVSINKIVEWEVLP